MQERYLGDVHDFAKYALLRHLGRDGLRPGILWYLTRQEEVDGERAARDGKHRGYLTRTARLFRHLDEPLHAWSLACESRRGREFPRLTWIESFLAAGSSIQFHGDPVPRSAAERDPWIRAALDGPMRDRDVVFLDPDNGMEPPSGPTPKHARWTELQEALRRGKSAIVFQHKHRHGPFADQTARWLELCTRLLTVAPFALRYHRGGCVALLFLPAPAHGRRLREAAETFLANGWRREGRTGHMELQEPS